jgi:hypothetical protein
MSAVSYEWQYRCAVTISTHRDLATMALLLTSHPPLAIMIVCVRLKAFGVVSLRSLFWWTASFIMPNHVCARELGWEQLERPFGPNCFDSPIPLNRQYVFLSIVIPIYNECGTLAELFRRVQAIPIAKEIILVDDGSTDGTREMLRSIEGQKGVRIFYHSANFGKGAALKTAFLNVSGSIVIVQDADLEYNPNDYHRLIEPILRNQADVVYGSRFVRGISITECTCSLWRCFGNRVLTTLSNVFTTLHLSDMETCYKVFRLAAIHEIAPRLRENRFGIEPEITAKIARGGYRICEVGVSYTARTIKEGKKIGWRDVLVALWCIVRYWIGD